MGSVIPKLPYWQSNIPETDRTEECPEGLRYLSEKDVRIISTPDAEYKAQTWQEVRNLVAQRRLDLFQRVPSELRRYRIFIHELIKEHGSVMNFVLTHRLRWDTAVVSRKPFENSEDVKILYNDWPYGIDKRIMHLIVWTRFELEEDPRTGDLADLARTKVEHFVQQTFRTHLQDDTVIWFRNWSSLKSVHAVEHFHVMLFDPPREFVDQVTRGDRPLSVMLGPEQHPSGARG